MQPFLAMIVPMGAGAGGPVDPGYSPPWATPGPMPPPGIWPGPHPSHPITLPGMPGFGGGGTPPQPPLGIWGGPYFPPRPDQSLPPFPSPPIYIPPEGSPPPLGIWGPTDPRPSNPISGIPGLPGSPGQQPQPAHPIVLPPGLPPTIPPEGGQPARKITWKTAWTPTTGWIVVGIPAEGTLVPTPSGPPPATPA